MSIFNEPCIHLANRLWRRKYLIFVSILLVSLIITVSYTNTPLPTFSSLFANNIRQSAINLQKSLHLRNLGENQLDTTNSDNRDNDKFAFKVLNDVKLSVKSERELPNRLLWQKVVKQDKYTPSHRMVHLDLKGAPPKIAYFRELFPLLKRAGANGLLIEYEDVFPYEGDLKLAVAHNSYSKADVNEIKMLAKENSLNIVPLVQTFGHLEYFLKLQPYRHLRETDEFPQAICPSRNESFRLVTQIIDQVMAMHRETRWLHIGCDEVFHIALCDICRRKDRDELFLSHVQRVSEYVRKKHNVIPIIWDDMLRQFPSDFVRRFDLDKIGVEIMVWTYIDDIYRFIPAQQWLAYSEVFPNVWGASAFKGAFGETLTVPNIKMHLDNNKAWLEAMREQTTNFKHIQGLVLTGWQRYDHLGNLCELIPSALPSLIIDLLTVTNGKYETRLLDDFDRLMQCEKNYYYPGDKIFTQDPNFFSKSSCKFPGSNIFKVMKELASVEKGVNDYLYDVTIHKAWLQDYNFRHNLSSPFRINEGLQEYYNIFYGAKSLLRTAVSALSEVYDNYTVYEWVEQKIYPHLIRLEKFYNNTIQLQKARVWPKRPLPPLEDINRFMNDI